MDLVLILIGPILAVFGWIMLDSAAGVSFTDFMGWVGISAGIVTLLVGLIANHRKHLGAKK